MSNNEKNPNDLPVALIPTGPVTMTSLELVDFINSQRQDGEAELAHRSFMAKVPKVLGVDVAAKFIASSFYVNGAGAKVPRAIYTFPKREACLMAMSYSYELQAKVFDRMTALEQRHAVDPMQLLNDPPTLRKALLTYTEKVEVLEQQVEELAPKAEALDRIADTDGLMTGTAAAKALQVPPRQLFDYMRQHRWIYRRPGSRHNMAYQDKIEKGYLTHKAITIPTGDGGERVDTRFFVTPKGLAKLAECFIALAESE